MSELRNNPEQNTPLLDRDLLVSRLVDGRAGEGEWSQLRVIAESDPTIWVDVRDAQRAHEQLCCAVAARLASTDRVGLSFGADLAGDGVVGRIGGDASGENPAHVNLWRTKRAGVLGWGVAACLALGMTGQFFANRNHVTPGNTAGIGPAPAFTSPDQALDAYMELGKQSGRVVGEMPQRHVIQSRPVTAEDGGGMEVLYLRQLIERTVVKDMYRLGTDELGRTVLVPTPPPAPPGETPSPL